MSTNGPTGIQECGAGNAGVLRNTESAEDCIALMISVNASLAKLEIVFRNFGFQPLPFPARSSLPQRRWRAPVSTYHYAWD